MKKPEPITESSKVAQIVVTISTLTGETREKAVEYAAENKGKNEKIIEFLDDLKGKTA